MVIKSNRNENVKFYVTEVFFCAEAQEKLVTFILNANAIEEVVM